MKFFSSYFVKKKKSIHTFWLTQILIFVIVYGLIYNSFYSNFNSIIKPFLFYLIYHDIYLSYKQNYHIGVSWQQKKIISSQLNLFLINNRIISCYCVHAKEISEGNLRVADERAHVLEDWCRIFNQSMALVFTLDFCFMRPEGGDELVNNLSCFFSVDKI